ncbi:hypothetical protein FRC17_009863 [Serendipita sp. 399]|nr:hypothetical protein FRC17_009863 [Serendipita sp. 399]
MSTNSLVHNGFKAWINSNGRKIPVYQVKKINDNTISCWIPSTPETPFSVVWRKTDPREIASAGHIFIDGRDVASGVMRPKRKRFVERSAAKTSHTTQRNFTFTRLELTDDEQLAPLHDDRLNEAGTIRLEVTYVHIGNATPVITTDVENITIAHEKDKKAGAMVTTFAQPQRMQRGKAISTRPFYADNPDPHVIFVFRYHEEGMDNRPVELNDIHIEMLKAWGIIPTSRPVTSQDLTQDSSTIDLNDDAQPDFSNLELEVGEAQSFSQDLSRTQSDDVGGTSSSQAESEALYDMGDAVSLFNGDEEDADGNTRRFKCEERMTPHVLSDEPGLDHHAPIKKEANEDEEPMEGDD